MTDTLYRRPSWVRLKVINPLLRVLVLRGGLGRRGEQNAMRVLRVRGRRSGREYEVPVRIAIWNGKRYVVSLLGEAEWVRNLRATPSAQLLVGTHAEQVVAYELQLDEKAAFLRWYCQRPEHRLSVRAGLRVDPEHLTPSAIDRVGRQHPIFRLDATASARETSTARACERW